MSPPSDFPPDQPAPDGAASAPVPPASPVGDAMPPPPAASPAPAPAVPTPPPLAPAPVAPTHPFTFHGEAREFFRIWIVNTLLTLLTLGVFFPWAKVRKRRYLRGSTELMGHRFDYRADPLRLLVGHALIVTFFLGYSVFGVVYPVVRWGVVAIGVVLLPWIVVRSLSFNAHNTAYRGLRFRFNASLSPAVSVFLLQPVLLGFTLGCYYPAWARAKRQLIVGGHRLGDAYFHFEAKTGPFYAAYFIGGVVFIGSLLLAGMIVGAYTAFHPGVRPNWLILAPFFAVYGLGWWIARQLIHARLFNHVWNHTRLDDHRFQASMDSSRWLGLQLVNLGVVLATLGALYPWAVIRLHRYTASCLRFAPAGPVETIERLEASGGSATGDTAAEFVGLDFGL